MKKPNITEKTGPKRLMYAFPRASFGDLEEFIKNHYPEKETAKPELMSLRKAKESGLVPKEEKVTSYKALFVTSGPIELNPHVVFVNDDRFMDKLKAWYFSDGHYAWVMKQSEEATKEAENYYNS